MDAPIDEATVPTPVALELPGRLLRGCAAVSLLALLVAVLSGSWRAEQEVREEMQAAMDLALVLSATWGLTSPDAEPDDDQALSRLQQQLGPRRLRHLELSVRDAEGRRRWALLRSPPSTPSREDGAADRWARLTEPALQVLVDLHRRWQTLDDPPPLLVPLARPSGEVWSLVVSPSPDSERRQALTVMLRLLAVLLAGTALLLLVLGLQIRRLMRPMQSLLALIADLRLGRWSAARVMPPLALRELQAVAQALSDLGSALDHTEAQRQLLAQRMLTLQEDERRRIAQELHDELGQRLTALRLDLAVLLRHLSADPPAAGSPHEALWRRTAAQLAGLQDQVRAAQEEVRSLLGRLAPRLDDTLPAERVTELLQSLMVPREGLTLRLNCVPGLQPWPSALALAVYRLSQEAVTNTLRHAEAKTLALEVRREGRRVIWRCGDDGRGLGSPEQAFRAGNGLAGMRQRVWAFGGDLSIESSPAGLQLSAVLEAPSEPRSPPSSAADNADHDHDHDHDRPV